MHTSSTATLMEGPPYLHALKKMIDALLVTARIIIANAGKPKLQV